MKSDPICTERQGTSGCEYIDGEKGHTKLERMDEASRREGLRLFFDVFKHVTSLSSGSIIVLATFLDRLDNQPHWQLMVPIAFLGFMVATVGSIIVMLSTARTIRRNDDTDHLPDKIGAIAYGVAIAGFAIGVIAICAFAARNF